MSRPWTYLFLGAPGDGRTSVVKGLSCVWKGPLERRAVEGVAEPLFMVYEGWDSIGNEVQLIDSRGLGDRDVPLAKFLAALRELLEDYKVHWVYITHSMASPHLGLSALAKVVLRECLARKGGALWDRCTLLGTKRDRVCEGAGDTASWRAAVGLEFFENVELKPWPVVTSSSTEPDGLREVPICLSLVGQRIALFSFPLPLVWKEGFDGDGGCERLGKSFSELLGSDAELTRLELEAEMALYTLRKSTGGDLARMQSDHENKLKALEEYKTKGSGPSQPSPPPVPQVVPPAVPAASQAASLAARSVLGCFLGPILAGLLGLLLPDKGGEAQGSSSTSTPAASQAHSSERDCLMVSARFDSGPTERFTRATAKELKRLGVPIYIVQADAGQTFGDLTVEGLHRAKGLLCFLSSEPPYGEKTASRYCSYWEVKYALEKELQLIPVRMSEDYPPNTGEQKGTALNSFAFGADLVYVDARGGRTAVQVAEEVFRSSFVQGLMATP